MTLWTSGRRSHLIGVLWVMFPILLMITGSDIKDCDRGRSRQVQKVIESSLLPEYERLKTKMLAGCPLDLEHTVYAAQEKMKYKEHPNKWVCYQCGKSFYEERYLDNHMNNRHSFLLRQGADVLCLADMCDVFRCEVLVTDARPSYWTHALCNENKLQHHRDSCQELVNQCVPADLEESDKQSLTDALNNKLCKYLNCKEYWEQPQQVSPLSTALYVMAFMVLSVALFIYYYIAYTHFYTDDSLYDQLKNDDHRPSRHIRYPQVPGQQEVRYRSSHR